MFWNDIELLLEECKNNKHSLFEIVVAHIENSLSDSETTDHEREVLKKVYARMYE